MDNPISPEKPEKVYKTFVVRVSEDMLKEIDLLVEANPVIADRNTWVRAAIFDRMNQERKNGSSGC